MRLRTGSALVLLALAAALIYVQQGLLPPAPECRIEAYFNAQEMLETAASLPDAAAEDGHLVFARCGTFAPQFLSRELAQAGVPPEAVELRDYSWAGEVLRQSGGLWRFAAAAAFLLFFCRWTAARASAGYALASKSLQDGSLIALLSPHIVRMLFCLLLFLCGLFASIVLVRWLWDAEIVLPGGFLPPDSLFDAAHYVRWSASAFPESDLSAYAANLSELLKKSHFLATLHSVLLLISAVIMPVKYKKRKFIVKQI